MLIHFAGTQIILTQYQHVILISYKRNTPMERKRNETLLYPNSELNAE